jgi:hypothetical protein
MTLASTMSALANNEQAMKNVLMKDKTRPRTGCPSGSSSPYGQLHTSGRA